MYGVRHYALLTKRQVEEIAKNLKLQGCKVKTNADAGTCEATDGLDLVMSAMEKGKGEPWIVYFHSSKRIVWHWDEDGEQHESEPGSES